VVVVVWFVDLGDACKVKEEKGGGMLWRQSLCNSRPVKRMPSNGIVTA
jgi:hypothetical protein